MSSLQRSPTSASVRNRKDHYLPQGYLRGFIDPIEAGKDRPLWCLDKQRNQWQRKASAQICRKIGFYDSSTDAVSVEHADVTFKSMEDGFPSLRQELQDRHFIGWREHLDFLLSYMQMIRARSPLFFDLHKKKLGTMKLAQIKSIAEDRRSLIVDDIQGRLITGPEMTDMTLGQMRAEIKKGADWMTRLHWTIRVTLDPHDPVITSEHPLFTTGEFDLSRSPIVDPSAVVYFPLCWQACLMGRVEPFSSDIDPFRAGELDGLRSMISGLANELVISPHPIPNL
jgi:Protein of unknown function (DUF4238)